MKPWPHTTVTFVSSGKAPGHVTRDVLVNDTPVTVEEGTVDISQPANNDVQRVTLTLLPDEIHFIGPDEDGPASTETARNGDLSDDGTDPKAFPTDPPAPEKPREAARAYLTDEPEVGAMVVDRDGDVWERTRHGWGWYSRPRLWGCGATWEAVCDEFAPLRLATPDDLTRVGLTEPSEGGSEPAADSDDEALANALLFTAEPNPGPAKGWGDAEWRKLARAARKHIEEEGPLAGKLDAAVWHRQFEKEKARAEEAESKADRLRHERDDAKAEAERLRGLSLGDLRRAVEAERERDDWQAKHEALRVDVEEMRTSFQRGVWPDMRGVLDRDDARDPSSDHHRVGSKCQRDYCEKTHEPDTDTVTLRRDDVGMMLADWEEWLDGYATEEVAALRLRVRAALGWGDEA